MPAPATIEDFVGLVRQSGLVPEDRLELLLKQELPQSTPRRLAAMLVSNSLLTRFQAEQILRGKWRGFTIGKYKVLERVGSGGNSNVYLCEHKLVRRRVAIKVLPVNRASNPSTLARFYREARASGSFDHPNLVKAFDVGEENGLHFLVMDYVDGSSLQDIVTRFGPLPVPRAVEYMRQTALGLHRIHEGGLVHRDVKPGNILLDRNGLIRLLDLGLARFLCDERESLTLELDGKNVLGTADYISPEQALNSHEVDLRTDIYGLGATFYFLLSGQTLFPCGTITQKLMWHQVRQPVPLSQLCPEVPSDLATLIMKMVAKNPGQRPQNMGEVILALTPWSGPVDPPPEAEMPSLSPAARTSSGSDTLDTLCSDRTRRPCSLLLSSPSLGLPASLAPAGLPSPDPRTGSRTRPLTTACEISFTRTTTLAPPAAVSAAEVTPTVTTPSTAAPPSSRSRRSPLRLAFILLLGIAAGTTLRCMVGQQPHAAVPNLSSASAPLVVSRSGGPDVFASVQEALLHAQAGDRILVFADTWEEVLRCPGASLPRGLRIEGRSATKGPVLWRAPAGHPANEPLIQLSDCVGLTLTGFTLDGQGRLQNGIAATGVCPGLCLQDLHLRGFERSGVLLNQCRGSSEQPVTLRRLRFTTGRSSAAALRLDSAPGKRTRCVGVTSCRFEGPFQAAIQVSGPCEDTVFHHNRVHAAREGVLCSGLEGHRARLTLSSNTFFAIENAVLHLTGLPDLDQSHLQLTRNLFVNTGPLAHIDGLKPSELYPTVQRLAACAFGNVCDCPGLKGPLLFGAATRRVDLAADSSDDTHFLRYPATLFPNRDDAPGVPPVVEREETEIADAQP